MKSSPLLAMLFAGLLLTGCATFTDAELGVIQRSGVSPRLITKMEDGRVLTPEDLIELTRRRVPDPYLLRQIDDVGVDYVLSAADFKKLQQARVSPAVVDALVMASAEFASRYAAPRYELYAGDPLLDPYPYPYYDGYYGPYHRSRFGGSVGFGFSTRDRRHHHHRHH